MNKTKIIVPALALAMGAALAGSVSGTVAWFQYSTRAQAAFIGTTAHCSEALEIQATAVDADADPDAWGTELTASEVATACGLTGTDIAPVTSGEMEADGELDTDTFKSNPIYQHFEYDEWIAADTTNFYQFELKFRVKDIDGKDDATYLSKDLYLIDLDIVSLDENGDLDDSSDLYKAVRVHINCGNNNLLFANDTEDDNETISTAVGAYMDLNNDGNIDTTEGYEWNTSKAITPYGGDLDDVQVAYNANAYEFADDATDPSNIDGDALGTIGANEEGGLTVKVTMWIEGWQELSENPDDNAALPANQENAVKLWDPETYIGARFGVGFRFACDAHVDHSSQNNGGNNGGDPQPNP